MKNIIIKTFLFVICLVFCCLEGRADVLPYATEEIPTASIGLYQVDKRVTIHEKPEQNSKVILDCEVLYPNFLEKKTDNMFAILLSKKEISYLYVTDISDDENWLQVVFDKKQQKRGWVYKNDDFQFMPWISFINIYGRKYGLKELQNSSHNNKIYSQPDSTSQTIGELNRPKFIRLTAVEGNWVLVSILDLSSETTTGYIQWRNKNGQIYIFPMIK